MGALSGFKTKLQTPTDEAKASQEAAPAAGDFATVGGFQQIDGDHSASEIDVTNQSSNESRELLNERGIRSMDLSGSGVLLDSAIAKALEANLYSQKLRWVRILQEDDGGRTRAARCKITNFTHASAHDGSVTFTITLMSSGPVTLA